MEIAKEQEFLEKMRDSIASLDMEATKVVCLEAVKGGIDPYRCIIEGLSLGLEIVGEECKRGEYFLMELIMAGETMKEAVKIIEPYMSSSTTKYRPLGKVVIGAVKGDLHDIGKSIVILLLKANNFDVYDLGSDVPAEKFLEAVRAQKPDILGMSALLTTTLNEMETVVRKLERTGLRNKEKVIIGGGAVYESFAKQIGADGWSNNAVIGVEQCKRWVKNTSASN